ncbi:lyase family protein, partial [Campylobacter jejuni]
NEDIQGSIAHATMLESCGILKKEELDAIIKGLEQVRSEIEQGKFIFDIKDEDIHMAVEKRLSEIIGSEIGGRLHTARSRNDQVATDFKLFVKKSHIELIKLLKELIQTMLEHAK